MERCVFKYNQRFVVKLVCILMYSTETIICMRISMKCTLLETNQNKQKRLLAVQLKRYDVLLTFNKSGIKIFR